MTSALSECIDAAADLDTGARAWVVGATRFVDADDLSARRIRDIGRLLEMAWRTGQFPVGPLAYQPGAPTIDIRPDRHHARIDMLANGAPFISVSLTLTPTGTIVCGTRSGKLADGIDEPSHVLLTDVEAGIVDLITFTSLRAKQIGYSGEVELALDLYSRVPGRPLQLRCYDEVSGDLASGAAPGTFTVPTARFGLRDGRQVGRVTLDVLQDVARQFGAGGPQLITEPDVAVGF